MAQRCSTKKPSDNVALLRRGIANDGRFFDAHDESANEGNLHVPDGLFCAMTWARQNGFSHVLFNSYTEKADDLSWYDW